MSRPGSHLWSGREKEREERGVFSGLADARENGGMKALKQQKFNPGDAIVNARRGG